MNLASSLIIYLLVYDFDATSFYIYFLIFLFFVILVLFEILSHYPNIGSSQWLRDGVRRIIDKVVSEKFMA